MTGVPPVPSYSRRPSLTHRDGIGGRPVRGRNSSLRLARQVTVWGLTQYEPIVGLRAGGRELKRMRTGISGSAAGSPTRT